MADEFLVFELARLFGDTLSHLKPIVSSAANGIAKLSGLPDFPLALLTIAGSKPAAGENGQSLAAATYLKHYIKEQIETDPLSPQHDIEFRNPLVHAMLMAEPSILKILSEALRFIVIKDFIKRNSWPLLVSELGSLI